jgi:hypothetical protein
MNPEVEKVLSVIKNATSSDPVGFDTLEKLTFSTGIRLEALMDDLYQSRPPVINRAQVTRDGKSQMVYWATGMIPPAISLGRQVINPKKRPEFPERVVKPSQHVTPATIQQPKELPIMSKSEEPTKSKVRLMLELLAEKGSATARELSYYSKSNSGVLPYLKTYMSRGLITAAQEFDGRAGKRFFLADGVTLDDLLDVSNRNPALGNRQTTKPVSAITAPAARKLELKIPHESVADEDLELQSIQEILNAIKRLDSTAAQRVMTYINHRITA